MNVNTLVYALTEEDLALASRLAHLRNDRKEAMGIRSKKFDPSKSEWDAHYQGILGELGAARALGLDVDEEEILSGDQGVDLTLPSGLTAEIRYRTRRHWDFALNGPDISYLKSDVGILVWPGMSPDTVELVGWTTRVHMLKKAARRDFGHGERLVLSYHDLMPMRSLIGLTRCRSSA